MRPRVVLPALLLLVGCGDPPSPPPGSGSITLGTTQLDGTGFLSLEGDSVLVPGAQGGFHVWVKYRVSGMSPGKVTVKRTVRRVSDNKLILNTEGAQEVGPMGETGYWEVPTAIPSFMCPSPLGVKVFDTEAVFEVQVLDKQGDVIADDTRFATPRCPTGDQEAFCLSICSG